MKYELHLGQNTGIYGARQKERPDEITEVQARTKKEAIHIALDKLLEAPKKYERAFLFDNENNMIIHIERC